MQIVTSQISGTSEHKGSKYSISGEMWDYKSINKPWSTFVSIFIFWNTTFEEIYLFNQVRMSACKHEGNALRVHLLYLVWSTYIRQK